MRKPVQQGKKMLKNMEQEQAIFQRDSLADEHHDIACLSTEELFKFGEIKKLKNLRAWIDFRIVKLEANIEEREKAYAAK